MARPLILHIGLPKTGSSSIQRVLSGERAALQAQGVYYPYSPGLLHHGLLPAALVNDPQALSLFNPGTWEGAPAGIRLERFAAEWQAEMAALPDWATCCIVSSEMIASLLRGADELARLAAWLRPHFDPIRVVVYLRRQDQQSASAYSQLLRAGLPRPPGLPPGGPSHHWMLDYANLLDRFAAEFGEAAIRPRIFERARLLHGDVVDDFLHVAGIELAIGKQSPHRAVNTSLSVEGQALLLKLGQRMAARASSTAWRSTAAWQQLSESVSAALPGPGWQPPRVAARDFVAQFAAGNERLRRRFFPGQASLFSEDFSALPEHDGPVAPEILFTACIGALLHEAGAGLERDANATMATFRIAKRLGDTELMQTLLDEALALAPNSLNVRLRAAEYCFAAGDSGQAGQHAEAALRIDPASRLAQRLQAKAARWATGRRRRHVNVAPPVARQ